MARQNDYDKKKRKTCSLCADHVEAIDFKDVAKLRRYLTEAGKIIPRRVTGTSAKYQRELAVATYHKWAMKTSESIFIYSLIGSLPYRQVTCLDSGIHFTVCSTGGIDHAIPCEIWVV